MKAQTVRSTEGAIGLSAGWEMYRLIAEAATDAIIVIDAGSLICFANPAAQQMFGYGSELLGESLTVLMPEPDRLRHITSLDNYKKTGDRHLDWSGVEAVALHHSGREIQVEISFGEAELDAGRFFIGVIRDITQHKQEEIQARQQAEAMSAILETTNDLVVEHDLDRLLQTIVERAAELLGATGGGIYFCEPDQRQVRCVVSYNTPQDYTGTVLKYGEGAAGLVALTGEPLIISDYSTWQGRASTFEEERPFNAVLTVPLKWRAELLGVLHVLEFGQNRVFSQQDQQVVAAFASQAAAAIYNARLIEDVRRHNRILSALHETNLALMSHLDLTEALREIITQAAQLVSTAHGYIYLLDPHEGVLEVKVGIGTMARYLGNRLRPGEGLAGKVWQSGQPLVVEDYHTWEGRSPLFQDTEIHAVVGVPLTAGEAIVGVLELAYLELGRQFGPEDIDLLNRFAVLASIALENTRLYQSAQNELAERKSAEGKLRASEERFRALVEHGADQISLLTRDGTLIYENPAEDPPLGYRRGLFVGQNIFQLLHPDDLARASQTWERVLAQPGSAVWASFRLRHADGSWRWMDGTATNLLNNPNVGAIVINYHDSTQRMLAEQALRESEARYHRLVEHLPAITYTAQMDEAHTRLYVSPQAEGMFGISIDMARSDPGLWRRMLHPDDRERVLAEADEFYSTGEPFVSDYRIVRDDGRIFWFHDEAVIVEDETTHEKFIHGVQINVTERRQAEEEVRLLNAQLEQRVRARTAELEAANRELEAFSYSVSHDLRAPLRAIDGYTRLLASDYGDLLPAEAHEYLKNVREGGKRMSLLISDMLALSRLTRHVLTYQAVNLSNIAQAIADELQRSTPERSVEFVIARALTTRGDSGLIQILLQNLIGNAWKFTSKREGARIEFGLVPPSSAHTGNGSQGEKLDGAGMVFFVRDNGTGFDMAHADTLFRAFQRLHTDADFEGTGIGLTIVQRIAERHGGRVWAEGEVGGGATFYFTL